MPTTAASYPGPAANAIVACVDGQWLPYGAATLYSCQANGQLTDTTFYLLTHMTSPAQKQEVTEFFLQKKMVVNLLDAAIDPALLALKTGRFSNATLLRLTLDRLLPALHQRVLYLDSDTLVLRNLADLLDIGLDGKALGAVEDYVSLVGLASRFQDHPRSLGLKPGAAYFNAGVLLFDWKRTLQQKLLPQCLALLARSVAENRPYKFLDQDVLNLAFADNWKEIGPAHNFMTFKREFFSGAPVIRHFNSANKPWGHVLLPGIKTYKQAYLDIFSGTVYSGMVKSKFSSISVPETVEFLVRKTMIASGLRRPLNRG